MRGLIVILLISGCTHLESYILRDGTEVKCKDFIEGTCGVYLGRCVNEKEYYCQTNIETGHKEKVPAKKIDVFENNERECVEIKAL